MSNSHPRGRVRGRRRAVFAVAVGVLAVGVTSAVVGHGIADAANSSHRPWLDAKTPISARVNALMAQLTLPEKVGQMDQQLVDDLTGPSSGCGSQGWAQLNQDC